MRSILIVANQTLGGEELMRRIREVVWWGPCRFHLVVPATPVQHLLSWSDGESRAVARQRLEEALVLLEKEGIDVTGEVGDANPLLAIADAARHQPFDEVIVSTLPLGSSRWLRMDLPARIRRRFGLPVTHVVAEREPQPS